MKPLLALALLMAAPAYAAEPEPSGIQRVVAVKDVCAWPNLTLLPDGTILAVLHNQPGHGTLEGDVDCYASSDGLKWEKRSTITRHEPNTIRMNHAAGLARNGDFVVLCSGWTNIQQPQRPKQAPFRDDILRTQVMRSTDGGRTWTQGAELPAPEAGWTEQIPFGDIWPGKDGKLHTSVYQGLFTDPAKSSKTKQYRSWHFESADDGRTWAPVSIIGPKHNETDLFPLADGSWLAAARIEAMELFHSTDNGRSWTSLGKPTTRNEINGHLCQLKDGRLLLTYGVRIKDRCGVCAKTSSDGGKTWSEPVRLAHSNISDCGYPSSVQRADGKIVTASYSKDAPEYAGYHMSVAVWTIP